MIKEEVKSIKTSGVDIVIPLYNKEATVARTIDSILKQTWQDWHLIIVDDGSTDNGVQVAKSFADSRITILQQENRGPGAARNAGINSATAPHVAFLDADDQWYPCYLENALKAIRDSNVSFVGSLYEEWPLQMDMTRFWAKRNVVPGDYEINPDTSCRNALYEIFFFHVGNTLVRRDIANKYGGFYDKDKCLLGEDTVFLARLALNEPFSIIGPVAVRHNRQDSSLSNVKKKPLDIFLQNPQIILDYCTPDKKEYAKQVLTWHAMSVARALARAGQKRPAIELRERFPEMRQFGFQYRRLCFEIGLSCWFPVWIKTKCSVTGPIKKWFNLNS